MAGLLRAGEEPPVLRQGRKLLCHVLSGVGGGSPDDPGGHAQLPGDGGHAGGGAQHVQVRELVAHDEHLALSGQQLRQSGGHHPAFYLGAALGLLGPAADEGEVRPVLDDHLVAPPAQGHVQGHRGVLVQLPGTPGVAADADGQGGGHPVGALDLADLLQNGEFSPVEVLELSRLHEEEVVVPVVPADHALRGLQPGGEQIVDLGAQGRALPLVQALAQVLVVVHLEDGQHRAGGVVLGGSVGILRYIHPVGGGQKLVLAAGAHQGAEDQILPVPHHHRLGAAMVPVQQPLGLEGGHQGGKLGFKEMVPVPGQVKEPFVAPDDVVGLRPEDHDGQGGGDHGPPGGGVHPVGHVVQIGQHLVLPAGGARVEIEVEDQHHGDLPQGEPDVEQASEHGKDQADGEKHPEAGLGDLGQGLVNGLRTHESTPNTAERRWKIVTKG